MQHRFITMAGLMICVIATIITIPVYAADLSAPLIDLPRVKPPQSPTSPVVVKAIVDDDVGVATVYLFYRILGTSGKFKSATLSPSKEQAKTYFVTLPGEMSKVKGIEYYVEARDMANNVTQEPFPNKPKTVYFHSAPSSETTASKSRWSKGKLSWGANIAYGNYTIDDPDGSTGTIYAPSAALMLTYELNRAWRSWMDVSYHTFSLPYSQTNIGQDVNSLRFNFIGQRTMRMFGSVGWIGAGLSLEETKSSNRGTEVNDVFLDKFDDRSHTALGVVIDIGYELGPVRKKLVGINGRYYTTDSGLNGFSAGIYIMFN